MIRLGLKSGPDEQICPHLSYNVLLFFVVSVVVVFLVLFGFRLLAYCFVFPHADFQFTGCLKEWSARVSLGRDIMRQYCLILLNA